MAAANRSIDVDMTGRGSQGAALPFSMSARRFQGFRHEIPLITAVGLLAVMVIVTVSTFFNVRRATAWVNHTSHVIAQINRVLTLVKEAESAQRGFLLTGSETFLSAYDVHAQNTREALTLLETSVSDSSAQQDRVKRLRHLVTERVAELARTAASRSAGLPANLLDLLQSEIRARSAFEIQTVAREMLQEESRLLEERQDALDHEVRLAAATIIVSGAIAFLMAAHTYYVMRRALRALAREAELLRQKERAERADREKSEFLANMSHEIRTPMNAVLGFTELLRGVATSPQQRRYVESIDSSGRALLALINDILDLSKIEAGKLELRTQPVSIQALLESMRAIFAQQATDRGLALTVTVDDSVPGALQFDAGRLRQILFNVVGNALKFTPQGAVAIAATARFTADDETAVTLELTVADTGIGIPPAEQEAVFEAFHQVRDSGGREAEGTGLGLSITRRLTQILGGEVRLASSPGAGTTFTFTFPRVAIAATLPDDETGKTPDADLNRLRPCRVLVADDVRLNRELLAGFFAGTHHEVVPVSGGREAVEVARRIRPDVVLMDIRMPDIDGREARRRIMAEAGPARPLVIAVTASSLVTEEENLRKEFHGYIRKPFSRARLFAELARVLGFARTALPAATTATAAPGGTAGATTRSADPAAWRELLAHLRRLERDVWPGLSRSQGYRETEQFAHDLLARATPVACDPVRVYAQQLLEHVESFEIAAQEETLRAFPALIGRIAEAVEGPRA